MRLPDVTGTGKRERDAFTRRAWGDAYALLVARAPTDADDLGRLAVAAHLVGRDDEGARAWERAGPARVELRTPYVGGSAIVLDEPFAACERHLGVLDLVHHPLPICCSHNGTSM